MSPITRNWPGNSRPISFMRSTTSVAGQGMAFRRKTVIAVFPRGPAELVRLFGINPVERSTSLCRGSKGHLQTIQSGERLDDFDLLVLLGKGAFASVFLARQNSMQRLVALKISADSGNEPQTLAQLDHEHIVRVFDQRMLADRGLRLLYMQYVTGGTLQGVVEVVRRTPLPNGPARFWRKRSPTH